jgi:hypothetical protein
MDLQDFRDKFWHAERYFNIHPQEEYFEDDKAYTAFKGFLNVKCLVYPICFLPVNNLFVLHYSFPDQKIAINFHLDKLMPSETMKPTEMHKLAQKVLGH